MNRRDFVALGAGATLVGALAPQAFAATAAEVLAADLVALEALLRDLSQANDASVARLLARQERRIDHPSLGGVPNDYGIYTAGGAAGLVSSLTCATSSRFSTHYNST